MICGMRGTGRGVAAAVAAAALVVVSCGGAGDASAPTSEPGTTTPVTGSSAPTTVPAEPDPGKPATPSAVEGPTALALDVATGEERWRISLGPDVAAGAAADGRVFSIACPTGQVGAADIVTGATLWTTPVDCREGTPGLLATTDIVVARTASALVGLAAETGAEQWRVDVPAPVLSFAFAADGELVVAGAGDSGLIAVDPATGAERWRVHLHGTPTTAVMPDGHVVAIVGEPGSGHESLVSFAAETGAEVWRQPAEGRGFPVAFGDLVVFGTVLPGSPQGPTGPSGGPGSGGVVALDAASGDVVWRRERDVGLPFGPLLTTTSGDTIVASWSSGSEAGPSDLTVEALGRDGSVRWETPGSRAVAVVDDIVVVTGRQDGVAGLDGKTGEERWRLRETGSVLGAQVATGSPWSAWRVPRAPKSLRRTSRGARSWRRSASPMGPRGGRPTSRASHFRSRRSWPATWRRCGAAVGRANRSSAPSTLRPATRDGRGRAAPAMAWVGWPAPGRWSWPPGPRASPRSTPARANPGSRFPSPTSSDWWRTPR